MIIGDKNIRIDTKDLEVFLNGLVESDIISESQLDDIFGYVYAHTEKSLFDCFSSYDEYLKSPIWESVRNQAFIKYGKECAICGSIKNLNVHHIRYDGGNRPPIEDLAVLCEDCHKKVHEIIDKATEESTDLQSRHEKYVDDVEYKTRRVFGKRFANIIAESFDNIDSQRRSRAISIIRESYVRFNNNNKHVVIRPDYNSVVQGLKSAYKGKKRHIIEKRVDGSPLNGSNNIESFDNKKNVVRAIKSPSSIQIKKL